MPKRKIIKIDREKCNGCGLCIPNCPEGALQVIDGKARLISDLFCDGLGACIGHCPQGAIITEEREAVGYDEKKVMENIVKQGSNTIKAHLSHLKEHGEIKYLKQAMEFLKEKNINVELDALACGCPGSKMMDFRKNNPEKVSGPKKHSVNPESGLRQWPVQLKLVPVTAPYLKGADLLVAADCAPFAYADFHRALLQGKTLLIGCPKLDDIQFYQEKLTEIFRNNDIKSVACARMEVPCCGGLSFAIKGAILDSGREIPFKEIIISIKGDKIK